MIVIIYLYFLNYIDGLNQNIPQQTISTEHNIDNAFLQEKSRMYMKFLPPYDPVKYIFPESNKETLQRPIFSKKLQVETYIDRKKESFSSYYLQHYKIIDCKKVSICLITIGYIMNNICLALGIYFTNYENYNVLKFIPFIIPTIIILLNYLSFYINRGIIFIHYSNSKDKEMQYTFPNLENDQLDSSILAYDIELEKTLRKNMEKNFTFVLYQIKKILSPFLNILMNVIYFVYVIVQFLALYHLIELPSAIGLNREEEQVFSYTILYSIKSIVEFFLFLYYIFFWYGVRSINKVKQYLINALIIVKNNQIIDICFAQFIDRLVDH